MRASNLSFLLVLVISSLKVSLSWYQMSMIPKKPSSKKRSIKVPPAAADDAAAPAARREPTGRAENLFRVANVVRRRLPGIYGAHWIVRKLRLRRKTDISLAVGTTRIEASHTGFDGLLLEGYDAWDMEQVRRTVDLPFCFFESEEEQRRFAAMKLLLEQELQDLQREIIMFPDVYGDLRLLRFLRKDKKQDPVSASLRYQHFLAWRNENSVDEIRALVEEKPFRPTSKNGQVVARYCPCEFNLAHVQTTCTGSKVIPIVLNVGQWDTAAIANLIRQKKLPLEDFLRYWIYMFESLHRHLFLESMRLQEMCYVDEICDLQGMSMKQFSPSFMSNVLKPWITTTQTFYPETTKRISLLNPPRILAMVWSIISPMASPGTVAKVRLFPGFKGSIHDFVHVHHPSTTRE